VNRTLKFSILMTLICVLVGTITIFNLVYIEYPEMESGFWMVFIRTIAIFIILPLSVLWGSWWVIKK